MALDCVFFFFSICRNSISSRPPSSASREEIKSGSPVNSWRRKAGQKKLGSPKQAKPAACNSPIVSPKSPAANRTKLLLLESPKPLPFFKMLSADSNVRGTTSDARQAAQLTDHAPLPLVRTPLSPDASPIVQEEKLSSWQVLHTESPNAQDSASPLAAFPAQESISTEKIVDSYGLHLQQYEEREERLKDDKQGKWGDEQAATCSAEKCLGESKMQEEKVLAPQGDDALGQKEEEADNLAAECKRSDHITSIDSEAVASFLNMHDQDSTSLIEQTGARKEDWDAGEVEQEIDERESMSAESDYDYNGDLSQGDRSKDIGSSCGEEEDDKLMSQDEGCDERDPEPTVDLEVRERPQKVNILFFADVNHFSPYSVRQRKRLELLDLEDSYLEEYGSLCIG